MASEISIQNFSITITSDVDTTTDVPIVLSTTDLTRVRLVLMSTAWSAVSILNPVNNLSNALSSAVELLNATTVRIHHGTSAFDRIVRFSLWEYTGPPGGKNEFRVIQRSLITFAGGVSSINIRLDTTFPTVDSADIQAAMLGTVKDVGVGGNHNRAVIGRVFFFFGAPFAQYLRGSTVGSILISSELVNWTGSNWTLQGNFTIGNSTAHVFTTTGSIETITIADVSDWSTAWIEAYRSTDNNRDAHFGVGALPGATTTTIRVFQGTLGQANSPSNAMYWWIIQNPDVYVDHTGSVFDSQPLIPAGTPNVIQNVNMSPAVPANLDDDFSRQTAICYHSGVGVGTNYGIWPFTYILQDLGGGLRDVLWTRGQGDFTQVWHQQIIQIPEFFPSIPIEFEVEVDLGAIDATIATTVQDVTLELTGRPVTLALPAVDALVPLDVIEVEIPLSSSTIVFQE